MARIAGVDLPGNKRIEIALTYIYGIGRSMALDLLDMANVDPGVKAKDLAEDQIVKLRDAMRTIKVEGESKRNISFIS